MRILVTGATGFVGAHLLPILASLPDARVQASSFDLRDPASIRTAIVADPPDICVHLAAIAAIPAAQADPDAAWQVNLHGTLHLARTLQEAAPACALIYASTADAYGRSFQPGTPVTEQTALAPMNTYAATKAAADLALGAMAGQGLRVVRVRPFNHTGPGQSDAFVVAAFARQVARIAAGLQPPVLQVGALEPWRDFLDVRDVCRAYALCVSHAARLPAGAILNIASGTPRRVGDVLAALMQVAGVHAEITVDGGRLRPSEIPLACGDAAAARAALGWAPQIDWATTLADIYAYWRHRVAAEAA